MKVKVEDKWYDANDVNLCVVFTDEEIDAIRLSTKQSMPNNRAMSGPNITAEELRAWANEDD